MSKLDLLTANDKQGEYPPSWYAATANKLDPYPSANDDLSCDVCVIGGGFTGLSTALHLARAGHDVILVDAQRVGWGASGRNGGQVGSGQRIEQSELEKIVGKDGAKRLWEVSQDAKRTIATLIKEHAIDCAYRPGVAHVYRKQSDVSHEWREADFLNDKYGYDQIEKLDQNGAKDLFGNERFKGGQIDWGAGHVHPLNLALGIAKAASEAGVRIFENTRVKKLSKDKLTAHLENGSIRASHMVLACNGYLQDLEGEVTSRVMPINNFIITTEVLTDEIANSILARDVAVADDKFVVNYWRKSADNRLIYGGGENYSYRFPKDIKSLARRHMLETYPNLESIKIDYAWGGTLGITARRMPYFTQIVPNVWSASGYSGHGVALATHAGCMIAAQIDGQDQGFDAQASFPALKFPGGGHLRHPLMVMAMTWYALRDRLGI